VVVRAGIDGRRDGEEPSLAIVRPDAAAFNKT